MEALSLKRNIEEKYDKIRSLSFLEKKMTVSVYFLKNITQSKVKNSLSEKVSLIEDLTESLESLTWFDQKEIDDNTLAIVNDLISLIRDLHRSLKRQYDSLLLITLDNKLETEFQKFEESLEYLLELSEDLESVFFGLPAIEDFNEVTKSFKKLS